MSDDKYKKVWLDEDGDVWTTAPDARTSQIYGPFIESQLVPADAVVIERDDLPEVHADKSIVAGPAVAARDTDTDRLWRMVLGYIAISEHLRSTPHVDQAEVDALAQIIAAVRKGQDVTPNDLADRILRHGGVRVEVTE